MRSICAPPPARTLPLAGGGTTDVDIWGYVAGDCGGAPVAQIGQAPVIQATAVTLVTVTLHNGLAEDTSLSFQGQRFRPTSPASPRRPEAVHLHGHEPGTFLYEAGPRKNCRHQVAHGLLRRAEGRLGHRGQAYALRTARSTWRPRCLVSEIDPALAANPTTFDMRNFAPKWTLLNGMASPATCRCSQRPRHAGQKVLIRYVNAGRTYHSMSLLGAEQP